MIMTKQTASSANLRALMPKSGATPGNSVFFEGLEKGAVAAFAYAIILAICSLLVFPALAQTCTSNPIVCENALAGSPGWDTAGDATIQGFTTDISVNVGQTIFFKVKTTASNYHLDIYRMGYYGGVGARLVTTVNPSVTLPQTQPNCLTDVATKLVDCGNWAVSASWSVPSTAVSGIYFAALVRPDTGGASHVVFIVRNDASHSDVFFQTSDETWQAYNSYGGNSLYGGSNTFDPPNRAYKVSYNRPFITRTFADESITFVFGTEYPMVRFLESNGYDVTYFTGVDAARNGALIKNHKTYLSVGHDEYWSGPQRTNVEAARDAGVNLAFLSGNEVFWKTRWENSIDGSGTPNRTLVCYKETLDGTSSGGIKDPADPPTWTGTWRDTSVSPPADGGRPENALTGTIFTVNGTGADNNGSQSVKVPAADGKMRFWRNTAIASLAPGATFTLPAGTLGYEWDTDQDNGSRPAGAFQLSTASYSLTVDYLLDFGATYGAGNATHHVMMYRAPSGALVFGAGTVQWSWGLDNNHDNPLGFASPAPDQNMRQATVNLFADMGVQPATIQPGLTPATKSTDAIPPISTITSPATGATIPYGAQVTITGTASDSGGGQVGGVEVSVDGGQTWHAASGRESWTYSWTAFTIGSVNIISRAVDDSGNIEMSSGITVTVPRPPVFPDVTVYRDPTVASPTITSPVFSTSSGTELLLAFVSGDYLSGANTTVTSVSGAGLTWVLAVRSNGQSGTAEIWRAFASAPLANVSVTATLSQSVVSSITVMSFIGVDTSGSNGSGAIGAITSKSAATGSPTATLVTTRNSSWVFGAGTDFDNPIARTPGTGQSLVHQYLTPPGDTYWVQMQNAPTSVSGTSVTINDTAPTTDRYNLSLVEILPAIGGAQPWSISGTISPPAPGTGTLVTLSGAKSATASADSSGNYTFTGLANGTYTVTPSKTGFTFNPSSQTLTINGANPSPVNFIAAAVPTWTLSGAVTPIASGTGATLTLSGAASATATADASGNYSFANLVNGTYTVTPSKTGFTFSPSSQTVTISGANPAPVNFTATVVPTWTISGTVNPAASGTGTLLTLSGAKSASATADASGNYSFAGLADGTYTVTPSKSGFTFSPTSQTLTINGANPAPVTFTATAVPTWNISGTISPSAGGAGSTVTLSGAASATTLADAGGNYAFTGLLNGTYTVTPSQVGYTFTPASQSVTLNGANMIAVNFTAAKTLTIDVTTSKDGAGNSTTIASPAFSTAAGNELLLAFVATDYLSGANTTVTGVTGGGLTWALVVRTNAQSGSSEIWRAFAAAPLSNATVTATLSQSIVSSITVMSFVGANTAGTNGSGAIGATASKSAATGAPTATLVTTANNSWVLGVGNDYDNAIARTPGAAQTVVHQDLTAAGDTYWVQRQTGTTPVSGTSVTLNDTAPTTDRYNLSLIEVLPAPPVLTWTLSGSVTPSANGSGTTLALSGAASASATADANGNYSFSGLANGSYTVTPSKGGFTFVPTNQPVTIAGANPAPVNFTAQVVGPTWNISGTITPTAAGSGATVTLSGAAGAVTTADAAGNYTFSGLANGTYTVTPSHSGYTFTPTSASVTISGANSPPTNFIGQGLGPIWDITGTISPSSGGAGATLSVTGAASFSVIADANGNYTASQLADGNYTITPSKNGYTFNPSSRAVTVSGANVPGINFTAVPPANSITLDSNTSKDGPTASATITTAAFSTTASNELLLALVATDYLGGANTTVTGVGGGGLTWTLVVRTNAQSGGSEIWRAFAAAPLSNTTVTATLSQSVVSSITVMSFTGINGSGTNGSGAIGATVSKSAATGAPSATLTTTGNNSWVLGVGNDFDNAITRTLGSGQSLIHQYLTPTGDTYWAQMLTNPVAAAGTSVTINDTAPTTDRYNLSIVEILAGSAGVSDTMPPTVSMASPAPGTSIASLETVSATASDDTSVAGVQFLLDGAPLGSELTTQPYSMTWNTTTVASGSHTLAARARDGVGLTTTSTPITIAVDNSGNPAVVGSWSSVVNLPAVAVNLILLQNNNVLFYQDGATPTVWNYLNNTFTNIPALADLFCSGQALLADGRILVVGGYGGSGNALGIANAEIFDPTNNTWTSVPNMAYKRWYPSATTLSDGRILVTAGWQTSAHTNAGISEIYNPATNAWTQLTNANNPFETYPFMYLLPDGRVIHIGGSEYPTDTDVLDLNTNTWSVVDPNVVDGGSATMYAPGKFMKAGSAADSQNVGPSSNTTFVLDMTQASPGWRETASMAYPRTFFNLTSLPDGSVVATGGETDKNGGNIANAVYAAELWSPQTQTWSTMASMHTPREYHGTALLLPDGRVLVSGMGADFGNVPDQKSAEFYSPPYLFKGARPTISQAPSQVQTGSNSTFFVGTPDGASIASVTLIRTGAVTHFFDQNERNVPLSFTQTSGGLTVTAPANTDLAPPGYYMLFIVNSSGVPSVAPFVKVQ
jgi:hypothetical protein